ncbi:hypothetical protein D1AOALGA4SA_3061 [Olavius algarvensis Delta 1 endosymbiont]|nr:hypothetical protein D1AOALGA4SA_3061 [Olavius algarvensis Delta 1 endosymbiont]
MGNSRIAEFRDSGILGLRNLRTIEWTHKRKNSHYISMIR